MRGTGLGVWRERADYHFLTKKDTARGVKEPPTNFLWIECQSRLTVRLLAAIAIAAREARVALGERGTAARTGAVSVLGAGSGTGTICTGCGATKT